MKELTPEELLDQIAQIRTESSNVPFNEEDSPSDEEEGGIPKTDTMTGSDSSIKYKQDRDIEDLEAKEAAAMPSMRRGGRYDPPGAFTQVRRTSPRHHDASVASSAGAPPPIHAVLVDNSSHAETVDSIYTAEPLGSIISKDPLLQKRWSVALVCLCFLGLIAIISVSVYFTIDKLYEKQEAKKSIFSLHREHDSDDHERYFTRHAVVFGTNTWWVCEEDTVDVADGAEDPSSHVKVVIDCNHAKMHVHLRSDGVDCEQTDAGITSCSVPIRRNDATVTAAYVSFDCMSKNPPKSTDLAATVGVHVVEPSSQCHRGSDTSVAVARMVSFCDHADEDPLISSQSCVNSKRIPLAGDKVCERKCGDGCSFQTLDYAECRPSADGQVEEEVEAVAIDILSDVASFLVPEYE